MASLTKRSNGTWIIQYVDADKSLKTLTLGQERDGDRFNKRDLQPIKSRIERLIAAAISGGTADRETLLWLRDLEHDAWGQQLRQRLADKGLVETDRPQHRSSKLIDFVDQYIMAGKTCDGRNAKPATVTKWTTCRNHLNRFFGNKPLRRITLGEAKDFRADLLAGDKSSTTQKGKRKRKPMAEDTVRRTCGIVKQFLADALGRKLIDANPFDHRDIPTATGAGDGEREEFITRARTQQVIDKMPTAEWKLIVALNRYGGLRGPSEICSLTWGDIDWEANRIRVPSPKTAHHKGKATRTIPLFDELRPFLLAVLDERGGRIFVSQTATVITSYRTDSNLGALLTKQVEQAGLTMWPKPFHNPRASRETELAEDLPEHVVCEWIGNSPRVAREHYLQVTEDHFQRALGRSNLQRGAERFCNLDGSGGNSDPPPTPDQQKTPAKAGECRPMPLMPHRPMGVTGLEPSRFEPMNAAFSAPPPASAERRAELAAATLAIPRQRTRHRSDSAAGLFEALMIDGHRIDEADRVHLARVLATEASPETLVALKALLQPLAVADDD